MKVRFPPEMKSRLEQAARDNNRSMNAEILARLSITLEVKSVERALSEIVDLLADVSEQTRMVREDVNNQLEQYRSIIRFVIENGGRLDADGLEILKTTLGQQPEPRKLPRIFGLQPAPPKGSPPR